MSDPIDTAESLCEQWTGMTFKSESTQRLLDALRAVTPVARQLQRERDEWHAIARGTLALLKDAWRDRDEARAERDAAARNGAATVDELHRQGERLAAGLRAEFQKMAPTAADMRMRVESQAADPAIRKQLDEADG